LVFCSFHDTATYHFGDKRATKTYCFIPELNKHIIKVLAVDSNGFWLYGLDRSNSYLRSTGNEWTVISTKEWGKVKVSQGVTLAKEVPENLLREDYGGGEILKSRNGDHWTGR
jgi:hypothetical protein